jgi:hypothetical protein
MSEKRCMSKNEQACTRLLDGGFGLHAQHGGAVRGGVAEDVRDLWQRAA